MAPSASAPSSSGGGGGAGGKGVLARVQLDASLRSSLVHLPMSLHAPLVERNVAPQNIVVELLAARPDGSLCFHPRSSAPVKYYCGWSGRSAAPLSGAEAFAPGPGSGSAASGGYANGSAAGAGAGAAVVNLSPALASAFFASLPPNEPQPQHARITLLRSPPLPTAARVSVTPLDADDWEILSTHAEEVELGLLSQCRAACEGMRLVVFVGKGARIACRFVIGQSRAVRVRVKQLGMWP